jgi:CheY-like chemotaxis protein
MQHREMIMPRILLVEDEPLISMVAAESLGDAGFEVVEAGTAAEAMSKLNEGTHFDAVIIDIGLPDRPGDTLAREIRLTWADLPIVIASGHGADHVSRLFDDHAHMTFLGKPYDNSGLVDALRVVGVTASPAS